MLNKFLNDKVKVTLENISSLVLQSEERIEKWQYKACDYKTDNTLPMPDDSWETFSYNDVVCGKDAHAWLYTEIKTPKVSENEEVYFDISTGYEGEWYATNPQAILYLNGEAAHGIDLFHRKVVLKPDTEYKIHLYFHTGRRHDSAAVRAKINVRDTLIQKLYYDIKVPYDAALCFAPEDYAYIKTMKHLESACNILDFTKEYELIGSPTTVLTKDGAAARENMLPVSKEFYESAKKAIEYLRKEYFEKECGNSDAIVNYVGHTHIDVAWLWTLAITKEKAQHSFATVLALMERYPEYIFMSSQPQLYEYVKEGAPDLYERIKEKVREGRWEVDGAMWLEADCNLSSGESLIRQILYGKNFMKKEFDVDSKILWLPDVFGYSAAMPQILKKSGVDKFVTSKISWNETNKMPYDNFNWQGIDGTEIFTYFLTAQNHVPGKAPGTTCNYNGSCNPSMLLGTWERYQQKELNNETIVSFGYGDGGGGPTDEFLEKERRLEYGLPGFPKAQMSRVGDFLDRVEKNFKKAKAENRYIPKWVGELYLEFHRGTYTSIAKNKKNNRECEFLSQTTETLSVINNILLNEDYPSNKLYDNWKLILLNQFHDIIPGSSIAEVYEDSDKQYAQVRNEIGEIQNDKLKALADNLSKKGIMVYNPNSFEVSSYVDFEGEKLYAESVPAMGWKVIISVKGADSVNVSTKRLENKYYVILFDENYEIYSILDKQNGREIIKEAARANVLRVYEDYPRDYDNWEITNYFRDKFEDISSVESVKEISENNYAGFEITRKYGRSIITQKIIVYANSRRIDFENDIDWHEDHVVLKALFPVDIHSTRATYEIQFGNVERNTHQNTSWDQAKFEVCAQKWIDLSESGYGVSILNNCKYGHSVMENEMSITLIKCGTYPHPEADRGRHQFTYSLLPHNGDYTEGKTVNEAYILNRPLVALNSNGGGKLPEEFSLINCNCENIVI
ncbi:MAG: alpha-mannosidase, partial [Ruminococcaceae bacterium]|nr:alpha-mannosidase [Oscillospiraceae bacterium]